MKKALCAAILSVLLLLSTAYAAAGSMANFQPIRTYENTFQDVLPTHWFYENVASLYALGLTEGKTETTFAPGDAVTVREVAVFTARVASLYACGDGEQGAAPYYSAAKGWDSGYLGYVTSLGIMNDSLTARLSAPATRSEAAHFLANALPKAAVPAINHDVVTTLYAQRKVIPDVTEYTPYQQDILTLYRWGISQGNDAVGTFAPESTITRGELAALLTRLTTPELRLVLSWGTAPHSAKGTTFADLVEAAPLTATHTIYDRQAADRNLRYLFSKNSNVLTLTMEGVDKTQLQTLTGTYLKALQNYPEQGYNAIQAQSTGSRVTLTFYSTFCSRTELPQIRQETLEAAIAVHDTLWQSGTLTENMSQYEIARVYYTYLCHMAAYDSAATDTSPSHYAHSLLTDGLAVCDGYTSAYNLLLKLEGISCGTYLTEDHIWTTATLDGAFCHIDVTWGDQVSYVNYDFFAMTPQTSLARFF